MASIQPVVFTLHSSADLRHVSVAQAGFPPAWVRLITQMQAELRNRPGEPNTPPWRSLNAVVRALVPHLLIGPKLIGAGGQDESSTGGVRPWVLTRERVASEALWLIVRAWLEEHFGDCLGLPTVAAQILADDLVWEDREVVLDRDRVANGTANPAALAYDALPSLLADYLVAQGLQLPVGDHLRPVVRVPAPHGAALVTWPPVYHQETRRGEDARKHGYSYQVLLTAQTVLGDPHVRVHAHFSLRRWHTGPIRDERMLYLPSGNTTAFVRSTRPWFGLPASPSFSVASLRPVADGAGGRTAAWGDRLPDIAARLDLALPDAEDLVRDPDRWLQGDLGLQVAIPQRTRRGLVLGSGLDVATHEQLTDALAESLAPQAALCPQLDSLRRHINRPGHPLARDIRKLPAAERLAALEESVGLSVTVEIYWQTETRRDALAAGVREFLIGGERGRASEDPRVDGAALAPDGKQRRSRSKREPLPSPPVFDRPYDIALPRGGRLRLVPRRLEALGEPFPALEALPTDLAALGLKERVKRLTGERATAIDRVIGRTGEPTLALVEMDHYRSRVLRRRFGWQRDPKSAVRLGLARAGRVSQFITAAPDATLDDRVRAAVRDGFRQLGYLPAPIHFDGGRNATLPNGLQVVAVWMVQLTRRTAFQPVCLPVVVVISADQRRVLAWLPDDKRPALRPYHQALIDLALMDPESVRRAGKTRMMGALQGFLTRDLPYSGAQEVVILVVHQNIRGAWKGLANKDIELDRVRFADKGAAMPVQGMGGRPRVIRLRTAVEEQTPEYYLPGKPAGSTAQGIWCVGGRTYFNIAGKPMSAGTGRVRGKQEDPTERDMIQSILEIVPLAVQDPQEVGLWAVAVDQWRRMTYLLREKEMTLLPLPLRFAKTMDAYARVIGPWLLEESWDPEEWDPGDGGADDDEEEDVDEAADALLAQV